MNKECTATEACALRLENTRKTANIYNVNKKREYISHWSTVQKYNEQNTKLLQKVVTV